MSAAATAQMYTNQAMNAASSLRTHTKDQLREMKSGLSKVLAEMATARRKGATTDDLLDLMIAATAVFDESISRLAVLVDVRPIEGASLQATQMTKKDIAQHVYAPRETLQSSFTGSAFALPNLFSTEEEEVDPEDAAAWAASAATTAPATPRATSPTRESRVPVISGDAANPQRHSSDLGTEASSFLGEEEEDERRSMRP
ncbi:hypothetical protein HKX48_003795 [Thoreauomyces humboldtii]|nr:hypothetical protein HKX48_003795 [Thoreauomyces humboldtii]